MVGYKLFKELDNGLIDMIRIVHVRDPYKPARHKEPSMISIYDYADNTIKKIRVEDIKGYTPLEPDAVFTAAIVSVKDNKGQMIKDVIFTAARYIEVKMKQFPYVVCRQNVVDMFNNLFLDKEENTMVGMSMSRDTCPAGFDFRYMVAADHVDKYIMVNFYRSDTVSDILKMIKLNPFDEVLNSLYTRHCNHVRKPMLLMKNMDDGWCKDTKTLLKVNDFQADINQMLNITELDFELAPYIVQKQLPKEGQSYESLDEEFTAWLSCIYKRNITDTTILLYDHDIDIVEFKDDKYLFIRDNTAKLYFVVYNENGELFEKDLMEKEMQYDFSTKFRLAFYNKYNNSNIQERSK